MSDRSIAGMQRLQEKLDCGVPLIWRSPFAVLEPAYKDARPAGESIVGIVERQGPPVLPIVA